MLVLASNLREYFREAMRDAENRTQVYVTGETQTYLIHLLTEFSRSEQVFSGIDAGENPAFALMISRALETEAHEAIRLYKHVGDTSLYFLGFFPEAARSSAVTESYYVSVGETAYSSASNLIRDSSVSASVIFNELADQFSRLVVLLHAMRMHGERLFEDKSTTHLIELIEKYRKSQDPEILEILGKYGLKADQIPKPKSH